MSAAAFAASRFAASRACRQACDVDHKARRTERHGFHWSRTVDGSGAENERVVLPCCAAAARNLRRRRAYQSVACSPHHPRERHFASRTGCDLQAAAAPQSVRPRTPVGQAAVAVAWPARPRLRRRHHLRRLGRHLRLLRLPVAGRDSRLPSERGRERLRPQPATDRPSRERPSRQRADQRWSRRRSGTRSSPRKIGASMNITVSTGAA